MCFDSCFYEVIAGETSKESIGHTGRDPRGGTPFHPDILGGIMPKYPAHVLELAKRGAEIRLRELAQEAKLLIDLFPHLRDAFDKNELPISFILARGSGRLTTRGGKRMSAAARKAVSARMKRYWRERRKGKA